MVGDGNGTSEGGELDGIYNLIMVLVSVSYGKIKCNDYMDGDGESN